VIWVNVIVDDVSGVSLGVVIWDGMIGVSFGGGT
jgi:hypothetical protein